MLRRMAATEGSWLTLNSSRVRLHASKSRRFFCQSGELSCAFAASDRERIQFTGPKMPSNRSVRRSSVDCALPVKAMQWIGVAVAMSRSAPTASAAHQGLLQHGALRKEMMEAIWVAAGMIAGPLV